MLSTIKLIGLTTRLGTQAVPINDIAARFDKTGEQVTNLCGVTSLHFFEDDSAFEQACVNTMLGLLEKTGIPISALTGVFGATNNTGSTQMPTLTALTCFQAGFRNIIVDQVGIGCGGASQAIRNAYNQLQVDSLNNKVSYYVVMAADRFSTVIDPNDYHTSILFSDGVAAVIITNNPAEQRGYEVTKVDTRGLMSDTACNSLLIPTAYATEGVPTLKMVGSEIMKFAIRLAFPAIMELLGLSEESLRKLYIIPHQANLRIIEAAVTKYGLNPNDVYAEGVKTIGNTLNASTIFGLKDAYRRNLITSDQILLATFGAEEQVGGVLLNASRFPKTLVI